MNEGGRRGGASYTFLDKSIELNEGWTLNAMFHCETGTLAA